MESWREIKPIGLPHHRNHPWRFAVYWEYPISIEVQASYSAFLFRNEDRTIFGIKELVGDRSARGRDYYRKLATQIITDKTLRDSLISSDPDLPKMWKRH